MFMKKIALALLVTGVALMAADGAALYKKCAACHGVDGKKPALNKSGPIAGLDKAVIMADLNAYKAGTLNRKGMGNLMKTQMAAYSDADIEAVAAYISGL
jgi:cytochrome c